LILGCKLSQRTEKPDSARTHARSRYQHTRRNAREGPPRQHIPRRAQVGVGALSSGVSKGLGHRAPRTMVLCT